MDVEVTKSNFDTITIKVEYHVPAGIWIGENRKRMYQMIMDKSNQLSDETNGSIRVYSVSVSAEKE